MTIERNDSQAEIDADRLTVVPEDYDILASEEEIHVCDEFCDVDPDAAIYTSAQLADMGVFVVRAEDPDFKARTQEAAIAAFNFVHGEDQS